MSTLIAACVSGSPAAQGVCPAGYGYELLAGYLPPPETEAFFSVLNAASGREELREFFLYGFSLTLSLWLLSLGIGIVLAMVRRRY